MFIIRDASLNDIEDLLRLASFLNTVNLPANKDVLEQILTLSESSFGQKLPPLEREYLFVMEGPGQKQLVGTSMIIAQHGTKAAPHIFFEVLRDEKYSSTLQRHFVHQVLKIGYSYNGPTEIGGIVLDPAFRKSPEKLGKQLSFVRFLYIAKHPKRFRGRVLAELLPPLQADGTSLLWESLGRHFTGLTYLEADQISKTNKEFIRTLFPSESIYTTLLPKAVQDIIGEVGPNTLGVAKMLEDIGFEYQKRIDPFDGGPHFSARVEHISLIQNYRQLLISERKANTPAQSALVAKEDEGAPPGERFLCLQSPCHIEGEEIWLPKEQLARLKRSPGERVSVLPL